MKGVSIVIITYNKRDILRKSLNHIYQNEIEFNEVVLVDNGSDDGTSEMIRNEFPQVKLIQLHQNKGVTEGRNIGAMNAGFNLLFFYDDDGRFDFSALPLMVTHLEEKDDVAIATGRVINLPAEDIFSLNMSHHRSGAAAPENIHLFKGGASIIKKNVFLKLGMYPDYFFYCCEEGDMSLRLFKKGYKILHFHNAIMLHKKSNDQRAQQRLLFYRYRNRLYQIWRNLPVLEAVKATILLMGSGFIMGLFTKRFFTIAKGFVYGLCVLPGVIIHERDPMSRDQYKKYKQAHSHYINIDSKFRNLKKSLSFWKIKNHQES